ncbi:Transposon Ty3-I Gag-Pol polyprotein [Abeliophyllum distichum]|uniref:Transposon Ty3-I Gag-Pol polyprotein n=1 Tax=Abeliophyllum distichum TaxID=126358 RepID=A0ABD1SGC7_9LAMI
MKFPTSRGISVRRDQLTSRRCYVDSIRAEANLIVLEIETSDHQQTHCFEPAEEVEVVDLEKNKRNKISRSLSEEDRKKILDMLRENIVMFAWSTDDLLGNDPQLLSID